MTLELHGESITYAYAGGEPVLFEVHVTVRPGCLLGIIGPNGSGKSTLLRILCGLTRPGTGRVSLGGKPLAAFSSLARARHVAYLPQSVNPAFSLRVFEVVCLGRYPHSGRLGALRQSDLDIARRCLRDTESGYLSEREFNSLSGGERQRVLLASVLAQEPDLLLLDEPASALDLHHQAEVFGLLRRLAGEGYGIALVTHDVNRAAQHCHELLLLGADHRVHAAGAPGDVLQAEVFAEAYGAAVRVGVHPFAGTPFIDVAGGAS